MKKSFSKILFGFIMLSLAIFSATFGIYAIMTAQMNMTLNIGYVSYNCSANVSGVITGAAPNEDGIVADIPLSNVVVNGKNNATQSMNLGTFYFTTEGVKNALGKPYPIKVWFTIENTSEFPICVEVSLPTITDVEVVADKTSHVIEAGETDKIMITFTLTNLSTTALANGFSSSGLNFTFKKFLKTKQDIVVYKDASVTHFENHPYYIKFGNYFSGQGDLIWLVGGTVDANGQTVALTEADKTQLNTGKFAADKDYYIITSDAWVNDINTTRTAPQNNCNLGTDYKASNCYLYEYPTINNIWDYSLSTVRQFLNRHTVYGTIVTTNAEYKPNTSQVMGDCVEMYSLDDGFIYPLIKKRSLSAIYKTLGYGNTELEVPTDRADNLSAEEADAFWLPTAADIGVLGDDFVSYNINTGEANEYYALTKAREDRPMAYFGYSSSVSTLYGFTAKHKTRAAFII